MKALVKKYAEKGIWMDDVPEPTVGINDVKKNQKTRGGDLRYRPAHLQMGRLVAKNHPNAHDHRP